MATRLESTQHDKGELGPFGSEDPPAVEVVPMVARALPVITARLRTRHPMVPAEVVEHHVSVAATRLMRQARIHDYLAILIERTASVSLAHRAERA